MTGTIHAVTAKISVIDPDTGYLRPELLQMKSRTGKIWAHIIGCIAFLALPVLLAPGPFRSWNMFSEMPTQREMATHILLLLFFYLNFFVLIPRLYFRKRYGAFSLTAFLCYLVISFLPVFVFPDMQLAGGNRPSSGISRQQGYRPPPPPDGRPAHREEHRKPFPRFFFFWADITRHLFLFLVVVFFSLMLQISNQWKRTEQEKLHAELSYLKAQINPHFLFNTLNSIYSLAIERSDQTATAVVKLSGMMRYVISEAGHDGVALEKEIDYIRDYIALQQIRFGHAIPLDFTVTGNPAGKKIAPLILIPFVENAFKHGINAEEQAAISIQIAITDKDLHLQVRNNKVKIQPAAADRSGLGIENTRGRLQLLYASAHTLAIEDNADSFSVSLSLHLI